MHWELIKFSRLMKYLLIHNVWGGVIYESRETFQVSCAHSISLSLQQCVYMWVCMRLRGPVCLRANIVMSSAYLCVGDEWPTAYNTSSLPPSLSLGVMNSRHVDLKLKKLTEFRPQGGSSPSSSSSSSSLTASSTSPLSPESGGLQVTFIATCSVFNCIF